MEENKEKDMRNAYNQEEAELIRKLVQLRQEQKVELEYIDLTDYETPPRTQFSMLKKPAVSIKFPEFTFNMACIRLFEGIKYIIPWTSKGQKTLVAVMCSEEEMSSVEWARQQQKDNAWVNKPIKSVEFVDKIFNSMNWDRNCRYKSLGRVVNSDRGLCLLFDLADAVMFDPNFVEYKDETTGETKKRRIIYYPDHYKDRIGKSYNDYIASQQMNIFDHLDDFVGKTYDDFEHKENENNEVGQNDGN